MSLQQLTFAALHFGVALRYRTFVPLLLSLETLKQTVAVVILWFYKPLPVGAPGKYGAVVLLPVLALGLFLSLRAPTGHARRQPPPARPPRSGVTPVLGSTQSRLNPFGILATYPF